jgi:alkylation response protein AidB-like acyl-CoA dehydrogenase
MDLTYTPGDIAFRSRVRRWFAEHAPQTPLQTLEERRAWTRKLYEAGFIGMGWPKAYGGQDARPMEQAIVADERARAGAPSGGLGLGLGIVGPTLVHHGTPEQKARFLGKILTAQEIWCQLFSEPNSGSDLASLRTRAVDKGDHYEVNGQKVWTSAGYLADWGLLIARTDPGAAKHLGISMFLLPMHQPGVEVRQLKQITGGAEFCEVFFTNARVDKDLLVGKLNQGWQYTQTTFAIERGADTLNRVTVHMLSLRRLNEVARHLKVNDHSAWEDPLVRQKLGRAAVEIEVMRYSGLRVLSRMEKGGRPGPESSIAKLYYSEFSKRYHEWAMEILGPYGGIGEGMPAELNKIDPDGAMSRRGNWAVDFLGSRAGTIAAGTSEIQKNIIGERVLGLPKEIRTDRIELAAAQSKP